MRDPSSAPTSPGDPSFADLFARARSGDRDAQGALIEQHLDMLRAYVRLRTGPALRAKESASDLVQSVCREALQQLPATDFEEAAAFRAWLCRVAMHKVLHRADHFAAARRDAAREQAADDSRVLAAYATFCTPSRDAIAREEADRIERAFDELPEDARDLIVQARVLGRGHREIAMDLGRSEVAVRKALSRALARLALALSEVRRRAR